MSKLLTINQVAEILGVSTKTLRRWEESKYFIPDRDPYANTRLYHPVVVEYWKALLEMSRRMNEHLKKLEPIRKELNKYLVLEPLSPGQRLPMMNTEGFSIACAAEDNWEKEWNKLMIEFDKFPDKMRYATGLLEAEEKNAL